MSLRFGIASWTEAFEPGHNRDATHVSLDLAGGAPVAHLAIADGASGALFSGEWARRLARGAADGHIALDPTAFGPWLDSERGSYDPIGERDVVDPFVLEKFERYGSQTTLAVATVSCLDRGRSTIRAVAVGDSVVIVVRVAEMAVFPPFSSADFSNSPSLISSVPGDDVDARSWTGSIGPDDVVVLATDAVAKTLIRLMEDSGVSEVRRRLGRLLAPVDGDQELGAALLDREGDRSFGDDATVIVCVATDAPESADDVVVIRQVLTGEPVHRSMWVRLRDRVRRVLTGRTS